jgi:hypothetical protein
MKRVYLFFGMLLMFMSQSSHAQQALIDKMMPKPVPESPNAASLGKYGDYQVSHFSGVPEISIPLYEIQSRV